MCVCVYVCARGGVRHSVDYKHRVLMVYDEMQGFGEKKALHFAKTWNAYDAWFSGSDFKDPKILSYI